MPVTFQPRDRLADFLAGWIGGCAGVAVSHPFDTVKVRLQSQGVQGSAVRYTGTFHCLFETVKKEKVQGLFKGITPPLIGTAAWNAIVFGVYGTSINYLAKNDAKARHSLKNISIAAVTVAFAQSVIICPVELIKSRLQIQTTSASQAEYRGVTDCVRKIYRKNGFRGFYLGMNATIIRDIPGFLSYFISYELICKGISSNATTQIGPFALLFAGGIAGSISWALVFPPDAIKTRIQVDNQSQYKGFIDCLRKSYQQEQWRLFTRGLAPTVIRAFPMNAAIFTVYTLLMRLYYSEMHNEDVHKFTT
eukprot:gene20319-22317_t